jgi:hypothetical protein
MAKRRIKTKNLKGKMTPIPHNNRADTGGRRVRKQLIIMKDKDNPNKITKKTIFHMNYSSYEQSRLHIIKEAVANNDPDVLKMLTPRERKMYDQLLKEKQDKENEGKSEN